MSSLKRDRLEPELVRGIRRFIANAILFNQRLANQLGLNATDYQMMNLLDLSGGETPKTLAEMTGLTTGGVTVALDRLEKQGYVTRQPNPGDRRSVIVRAVPEQIAAVQALYRDIDRGIAHIFASFSETELKTIHEFFVRSNAVPSGDEEA